MNVLLWKKIKVWPDKNVSSYVSGMGSSQQPVYHILSGILRRTEKWGRKIPHPIANFIQCIWQFILLGLRRITWVRCSFHKGKPQVAIIMLFHKGIWITTAEINSVPSTSWEGHKNHSKKSSVFWRNWGHQDFVFLEFSHRHWEFSYDSILGLWSKDRLNHSENKIILYL